MLGIYAKSILTATRVGNDKMPIVQPKPSEKHWLPSGHWFLKTPK